MDMLFEMLFNYSRSVYNRLSERRDSERKDFQGTVTVSCKDRYRSSYVCSCVNLSDSGIGLVSYEPIPLKCDVYVQSTRHNLQRFGKVRWCVLRGDRYFIGCSFRRVSKPWNPYAVSQAASVHSPAASGRLS
jgi:hypothetical protein